MNKNGPDVILSGKVLRKAAETIQKNACGQGWFDCEAVIEDGDVTHYFRLKGRLRFVKECNSVYCRSVNFEQAEVISEDGDGIGLTNDFEGATLEWFLRD